MEAYSLSKCLACVALAGMFQAFSPCRANASSHDHRSIRVRNNGPLHSTDSSSAALCGLRGLQNATNSELPLGSLTQLNNGPGLLICEPVVGKGSEGLTDFSAGARRWLQFTMGDNPELGKTARVENESDVKRELKSKSLQFSLELAPKAAAILGATHVAIGTVSGSAERCTLSYRLYSTTNHKPVGAELTASGTTAQVIDQIPAIARKMLVLLGVAKPHVADRADVSQDELGAIGRCDWQGYHNVSEADRKTLVQLSTKLPLASYLTLRLTDTDSTKLEAESIKRMMRLDGGSTYATARILEAPADLVGPCETQFRHNYQTYPNNALYSQYNAWRARREKGLDAQFPALEHCTRCSMKDVNNWNSLARNRGEASDAIRKSRSTQNIKDEEWKRLNPLYMQCYGAALRATVVDPLNGQGWRTLSNVAAFVSDRTTAEKALWKGIDVDPGFLMLYNWGLFLYQPQWFSDQAKEVAVANKAGSAHFSTWQMSLSAVKMLKDLGYNQLAESLRSAVIDRLRVQTEEEPTRADLHAGLGIFLQTSGVEERQCLPEFAAAVRLDPEYGQWHNYLALSYARAGKFGEGVAEARRTVEMFPESAEYRINYGHCLAEAHSMEMAEKEMREAIRMSPDNSTFHENFSKFLQNANREPEAEREASEAIRLAPAAAGPRLQLADVLRVEGELDGALAMAKEGLLTSINDPYSHYVIAGIYEAKHDFPIAERAAREGVRLSPKFPMYHLRLGNVLNDAGNKGDARAEWKLAVQLDPDGSYAKEAAEKLKEAQ